MAKTLSESAYNILNILRGGRSTNNEHLSVDQIKYIILYYRALILRRDLADAGARTQDLEQDLGLMELAIVDPSEGILPDLAERGFLMKTARSIPEPLRLKERGGITAVLSADFRFAFPVIDYSAARWIRYGKYTGKMVRSFFFNNHVFLTSTQFTQEVERSLMSPTTFIPITEASVAASPFQVRVRGVFEDPREAYTAATGEEWDDDVSPFPFPGDMEQRVVQSILSGEFRQIMPNDTDSNIFVDNAASKTNG